MKTPAPHFSYPKREGYFADTKRLGRAPDAPMAIDVPFDWTETQGDLAPVVRKINTALFIGLMMMVGFVAGVVSCAWMAGVL